MHWTTLVLIIVVLLVFGFVATAAIAAKLEIEKTRAASAKIMAEYVAMMKTNKEKEAPKKKAGRPSKKVK